MTAPSQGYVTIAYGHRKFYEMAVNFALSVKLHDPKRPVCLLYKQSDPVPEDIAEAFDRLAPFENEDRYPKMLIKLAIYEPSPFDETFYMDADCVLLKGDMDRHWQKYGADDFMIAGDKRTASDDLSEQEKGMMAATDTDYVVDMNAGVIFYRKSERAAKIFADAGRLAIDPDPSLVEERARDDGLSDQTFYSAAMAMNHVDPIRYDPEEGTIMATTFRARRINFDIIEGRGRLEKPAGFRLLGRFLAKGWVRHDTTVGHFIDGKPAALYQRTSDALRDHFGWPRYEFPA